MKKFFFLLLIPMLMQCSTLYVKRMSQYDILVKFYPNMKYEYYQEIVYASMLMDFDHLLVCSVAQSESNFKANAVNPRSGAQSLLQIHPVHGYYMDWQNNIKFGVKYLKQMSVRSNGNIHFALARYHAGPNKDLSQYKHWNSYVYVIWDRYLKTKEATS